MFEFEEANKWLKASGRGEWKVLERASGAKAVKELHDIAEKQPRGKQHFKTNRNAATVREASNVYYFEGMQGEDAGRPLIFVIGFGSGDSIQSINDLMGCEPSGAVSPEHIFAVEALSQACTDFESKVQEIVKKVVEGKKINDEEQKALIRTFMPPAYDEGYEVQHGLIGGGMGFMSSSSVPFAKFMNEAAKTPQMQNFIKKQLIQNEDGNNPQNRGRRQQEQQRNADPTVVMLEASLVALVSNNLPLNREQIRLVLASIENGTVFENDEGRQISVTLAALNSPNVILQIEEFLASTDPGIQKFIAENNIKPSHRYHGLCAKIKAEQERKEKENQIKQPAKKEPEAQTGTTPEEDIKIFEEELEQQLKANQLSEPEQQENKDVRHPKLKRFTKPSQSITINYEQIRTDKHKGGV